MSAATLSTEAVIHVVRAGEAQSAGQALVAKVMAAAKQDIRSKMADAVGVMVDLIEQGHCLSVGLSGGKDSTCCTILMLEAVRVAKARGVVQGTHYVTSASTGVESPAMESHLLDIHAEIEAFVAANDLPVEVRMVKPSLAAGFVVTTIGRGTLPRFPENGKDRQCSVDWKVLPQQRLIKELSAEVEKNGFREIVTVIGTRFEESAARAARMTERGESAVKAMRDDGGRLVLSVIASWALQDVWDMLELFLEDGHAPYASFTDGASIFRLFELYRDGNEGVCGVTLGDGGNKAPCGPRFGCAVCTITGKVDKSMESMLRDEKYAYMRGLNDFRNLLMATQHDYSKRELIGRTVSDAGFLPVRPDVYSLAFRRQLLGYLITLDVLEEERAERLAEDIATGAVPDTRENRRLTVPQFELVSIPQLVAVDFFWGMHPYAFDAFPAIQIWHEVRHLGRRFAIPKVEATEKTPVPAKRWFPVGAFDRDVPVDGLRDYKAELWNRYLHPQRPMTKRSVDGKNAVWFIEEDSLTVDATNAYELVEMVYPEKFIEFRQYGALEGGRFLLNEEIVRLPAGMAGRYQHMAERGQYFAHLGMKLNLAPLELDAYLTQHSITDAEHERLVAEKVTAEAGEAEEQMALF